MQVVATNFFRNASLRLGSVRLFEAGRNWTVEDAIAFAAFRGELAPHFDETLALLAAEQRVAALDIEISVESVQASSERFRYEHDLISAGEAEEWLAARGMTTDDFGAWLYRCLCREAMPGSYREDVHEPEEDFADALRVHLWLSGAMDRIVEQLSRRVSADRELASKGEAVPSSNAIDAFLEREHISRNSLATWLGRFGRDERWLEEMARMEAAFERLTSAAITGEMRARKLAGMQRSLSMLQFDLLDVDSSGAAREAFLCVHEDRVPLAEVAREAGYRVLRDEVRFEDLGSLAERLFAAHEGDVVGPVEHDGRFRLYHLLQKRMPTLADEAVARRIDSLILDELFTDLTARHVNHHRATSTS